MSIKETYSEPTDFLRKQGVIKVGHSSSVRIEEETDAIKICSFSEIKYYYADGKTESPPIAGFCATIPKELLPKALEELQKYKGAFKSYP